MTIALMGVAIARIIILALERPLMNKPVSANMKYHAPAMADREAKSIAESINQVLIEEKPFLDPEFNLDDLSGLTGHSRRTVSEVINNHLNRNFFDLVNSHRIESAKEIFKNNTDPKLTVLEVMFDVGFNSKSSFNTQFKKRTGLTPSEFMKLH